MATSWLSSLNDIQQNNFSRGNVQKRGTPLSDAFFFIGINPDFALNKIDNYPDVQG